jgi:hypothetical protein
VDPVPDPLLLRKSGSAGNRTRTSGLAARKSDHWYNTRTNSGINVVCVCMYVFVLYKYYVLCIYVYVCMNSLCVCIPSMYCVLCVPVYI